MKILSLDTTEARCKVALWEEEQVKSSREGQLHHRHAESLIGLVLEVMGQEQIPPPARYLRFLRSLDCYAVAVGPGSFTGIRVGLATARALALASGGQPVVGVSTFQRLAYEALQFAKDTRGTIPADDGPIAVTIQGPRDRLLLQIFDQELTEQTTSFEGSAEQVAARLPPPPLLLTGESVDRLPSAYQTHVVTPRSSNTAAGSPTAAASIAHLVALGKSSLPPRPLYYSHSFRRADRAPSLPYTS